MRLSVLLFASLRERVGREAIVLDLPAGATVEDLRKRMEEDLDQISGLSFAIAVNRKFADPKTPIHE